MTGQSVAPHIIRNARETEIDSLARIWFDGWQDAHADILPAELARLRTLDSFRERLHTAIDTVRVAGPDGTPLGFSMVKGDELYQLYVSPRARGPGAAAALVHDVIAQFREAGIQTGWLACAIGNDRAARFYEKTGWTRVRTMTSQLPTPEGIFPLDVWRYEISVDRVSPTQA